MKIVQLDIQGFRSLKNVSWRPGALNAVIGPNGSGKSNLLRALEMIAAAAQGRLRDYIQTEGGMSALVWDGEASLIKLHVTQSLDLPPTSFVHSYSADLLRIGPSGSYQVREESLTTTDFHVGERDEEVTRPQISRLTNNAVYYDHDGKQVQIPKEAVPEAETVLSLASSPLSFNIGPLWFVASDLSAGVIYHSLRVDRHSSIRHAPISRFEQRVAPDGQNLINVLHTLYTNNREFKRDVNDAMTAAFGEDFDELIFPPAADQRIQMRVRWKTLRREQSAADLSDGTLRFLFLLAVLATPEPPPLIAIDEPETGLHPSMLPIIAEFAVEASRRTQVIFTTHSDQFLDAFRETRPTTTVAKWENGETTLTTLSDEELAYWLQDYSLGRLFRTGELENLAA
jgi:predicted ATPase